MSDIKCPICGKDLVEIELGECWFLACCNSKCRCKEVASVTVWEFLTVAIKNRKALSQELIRTRKALDIAVDALKSAKARLELINNSKFANLNNVLQIQSQCEVLKINKVLEQITTLTKGGSNE